MNVRGCGRFDKQGLIERMTAENIFDICALSETTLKGSDEYMRGSIKGLKGGFGERCRARDGGEIMLSEIMWIMMRQWSAISSHYVLNL
jgi:hypothetical protein